MKKVILFTIQGCAPCEELKPMFKKTTKEKGWTGEIYDLTKADIEIKKMAHTFDITIFPTILIFNGDKVDKLEPPIKKEKLEGMLK